MMDEELEKRLRGLDDTVQELLRKKKSKELQKEIELRLAKLNDRDPNFYSEQEPPVKLLSIKKCRTAVEETEDLLKQIMEETRLEEKNEREASIADQKLEEKLQQLSKAQAELDTRKVNQKLKKFKQSGQLIHQLMMRSLEFQDDDDKQQEINWCSTCNEDGAVRCLDCDNDIFCSECFRELHRDRDLRVHRTQPYNTKSQR